MDSVKLTIHKNKNQEKKKNIKICLISSSGGHYEQLKMLKPLEEKYDIFWVTEKTDYLTNANYFLLQTGIKDKFCFIKIIMNFIKTVYIWFKERPDYVVTTGTMIVFPMAFMAKMFKKKFIYIETFARVYDGTRVGKILYRYADLFIIQWESLKKIYPKSIYGGSIY